MLHILLLSKARSYHWHFKMLPAYIEFARGLADKYNDYKTTFMNPHGPSSSYMWPKPLDVF